MRVLSRLRKSSSSAKTTERRSAGRSNRICIMEMNYVAKAICGTTTTSRLKLDIMGSTKGCGITQPFPQISEPFVTFAVSTSNIFGVKSCRATLLLI